MASSRLTFLGSGNAFNHDGRGSQCLAVDGPGLSPFLVDVGPTAAAAMAREGLDPSRFDRLFLTHLHGDHVAGWPFLLLHQIFLDRRSKPFDVYGPPGTRDCLEGLARLCYADVLDRQGFEVRYHEVAVAAGRGIAAGPGVVLDTWPMCHHPSSIGLRLHLGDPGRAVEVLGVSGDTAWCESLERLAEGCDLLVLECTTLEPSPARHLSLREIRDGGERLPARRMALTHLTDEIARSVAADPIPRTVAAYDGMVLAVGERGPARS